MLAVICLGAGKAQQPFIQEIKASGLTLIVIDRDASAPLIKQADHFIHESTYHSKQVLKKIIELNLPITALIARTSGPALDTAAVISHHFKLNQFDSQLVSISTIKSELRLFCTSHNIKFPQGFKADHFLEAQKGLKAMPEHAIIKPDLPIVGKQNIFKLRTDALTEDIFTQTQASSYSGCVELEAFIEGFDVTCFFLLNHGAANIIHLWDELVGTTHKGQIQGLGVSIPSVIQNNTAIHAKIQCIIDTIANEFNHLFAYLAISLRISLEGDITVIELHCDLTGDDIAEQLLPQAYGETYSFFTTITNSLIHKKMAPMPQNTLMPTLIFSQKNNSLCIQKGSAKQNLQYLNNHINNTTQPSRHLHFLKTTT